MPKARVKKQTAPQKSDELTAVKNLIERIVEI